MDDAKLIGYEMQWPPGLEKDITMLHMIDPQTFWVKEAKSFEMSSEAKRFYCMNEKMNSYLENYEDNSPFEANKGDICCVKYNDSWVRARILAKIDSMRGVIVRLFLLDLAVEFRDLQHKIRRCEKGWLTCPFQAVKITIPGLKPIRMSLDVCNDLEVNTLPSETWSESAISYVKTLFKDHSKAKLEVFSGYQRDIKARLFFYINQEKIDLGQSLIDKEYAISVEPLEKEKPLPLSRIERCRQKFSGDMQKQFQSLTTNPSNATQNAQKVKASPSMQPSANQSTSTTQPRTNPSSSTTQPRSNPSCFATQPRVNQSTSATQPRANLSSATTQPRSNPSSSAMQPRANQSPSAVPELSQKANKSLTSNFSNNMTFDAHPVGKGRSAILKQKLAEKASVKSDPGTKLGAAKLPSMGRGALLTQKLMEAKQRKSQIEKPLEDKPSKLGGRAAILKNLLRKSTQPSHAQEKSEERSEKYLEAIPNTNQALVDNSTISSEIRTASADASFELDDENLKEAAASISSVSDNEQNSCDVKDKKVCHAFDCQSQFQEFKQNLSDRLNHTAQFLDSDDDDDEDVALIYGQDSLQNMASFETSMASTFETLNQHIVGHVFSIGDRIPPPYSRVDNNFDNFLVQKLHNMSFSAPSVIQRHAWPSINRGHNVAVVAQPSPGNMLIFLIPIISSLLDKSAFDNIPNGNGPLAIILCPSSESVQFVYYVAQKLIENSHLTCHLLYPSIETAMKINLINGCDILVSTPDSLLRVLESGKNHTTNFYRLCYLVLNDADFITENCTHTITKIMSAYIKVIKSPRRDATLKQIIMCSNTWSMSLASFIESYFYHQHEIAFSPPVIHFSSFYEVAIYAKVVTMASVIAEESKHEKLAEILEECSEKKTVIFVKDDNKTRDIYELVRSCSRNAFLVNRRANNAQLQAIKDEWANSHNKKSAPVLICTDSTVSDLNIRDAKCLVHYDIPESSRSSFGNRFSLLHEAMMAHIENAEEDNECTCYLMLTNKCLKQSPALLKFLKRIDARVPDKLKQLVIKQKESLESSKASTELCPYFRAFGKCDYKKITNKNCKYRHADFNKHLDTVRDYIPTSGQLKVKIINVLDASHYYAHIVEHIDTNGVSSSVKYYQDDIEFFLELETYFAVEKNHHRVNHSSVHIGDMYAVKPNNTSRVVVISFGKQRSSSSSTPYEVLCHFIDEGYKKTLAIKDLLVLPDSLKVHPHLAIEVYACNVKPKDNEINWNSHTTSILRSELFNQDVIGNIKLCIGNMVWLHPLVKQHKLMEANTKVNVLTVDNYLVENGSADKNQSHLSGLLEFCKNNNVYIPSVEQESSTNKKAVNDANNEKHSYAFLDEKIYHLVQVSVVKDPHSFYVQQYKYYDSFLSFQQELNAWGKSKQRHFALNLNQGLICLAYFLQDELWCRAKVLNVLEDSAEVLFLDYGDINEVPKNEILQLPDKFLNLPFQAIECSLADVQLLDNQTEWSDRVVDEFENLTRKDGVIINIPLKVINYFSREGQGKLYDVVLLKPTMFTSYSVGSLLVDNKLAKSNSLIDVDGIILKYYKQYDTESDYDSDDSSIKEELERLKTFKEFSSWKANLSKSSVDELSDSFFNNEDKNKIQEIEELTPTVKWTQTVKKLTLAIKICCVQEYDLKITPKSITFNSLLGSKLYSFNLNLYGSIDSNPERRKIKIMGTEVFMMFYKEEPQVDWPRLQESEVKPSFLGIDFDRHDVDLDSDEEVSIFDDPKMRRKVMDKLKEEAEDDFECNSDVSIASSLKSDVDEFQQFC